MIMSSLYLWYYEVKDYTCLKRTRKMETRKSIKEEFKFEHFEKLELAYLDFAWVISRAISRLKHDLRLVYDLWGVLDCKEISLRKSLIDTYSKIEKN